MCTEFVKKALEGFMDTGCQQELRQCRHTNQDLQDANSNLIDQIGRARGELETVNAAYNSLDASLKLCTSRTDTLYEENIAIKADRDRYKAILESLDAGNAQQRVLRALKDEEPSAILWKDIDEVLNNFFKAQIVVKTVNMDQYLHWFTQHVFPAIRDNRGDYQFEDLKKINSCSRDDFRKIMDRDFIDKLDYTADIWDCENYVDAVKSRLARIYGITSVRRVCSKTKIQEPTLNHAIGFFYDCDGMGWIFEAQNDAIWRYTGHMQEVYRIENWYDYR